jgi:hypothetical protein
MGVIGNIRGYISVGWSTGRMTNLDIIMCYVDTAGTGFIGDFWVSGHNQPALDPDQTFTEVSVGRSGASLWCEFDRPYDNTAEPANDNAIPSLSQNSPFLWAVHRSSAFPKITGAFCWPALTLMPFQLSHPVLRLGTPFTTCSLRHLCP